MEEQNVAKQVTRLPFVYGTTHGPLISTAVTVIFVSLAHTLTKCRVPDHKQEVAARCGQVNLISTIFMTITFDESRIINDPMDIWQYLETRLDREVS